MKILKQDGLLYFHKLYTFWNIREYTFLYMFVIDTSLRYLGKLVLVIKPKDTNTMWVCITMVDQGPFMLVESYN